jgi:Ca2+-transporting ATPase
MKAVAFWIGGKEYHRQDEEGVDSKDASDDDDASQTSNAEDRPPEGSGTFDELTKELPDEARAILVSNIAVNSSAFEDTDEEGKTDFVGSSTETALLRFLKETEWADYSEERDKADVAQVFSFSSDRKAMGTVIKSGDKHLFLLKGAGDQLLKTCSSVMVIADDKLATEKLDGKKHNELDDVLASFAKRSLRNLSLCYKELDEAPSGDSQEVYESLTKDLTFLAIAGIQDPLRTGVPHSIDQCHQAGRELSLLLELPDPCAVNVIMCTGDSLRTAR